MLPIEDRESSSGWGIVLAAYGSLRESSCDQYRNLLQVYRQAFSGSEIVLAFCSRFMRRGWASKGIEIPSVLDGLAAVHEAGCSRCVIQSLQVVPGMEFHRLASLTASLKRGYRPAYYPVCPGFQDLSLGRPLLGDLLDCRDLISAMIAPCQEVIPRTGGADPVRRALVLMGHGSGHPGDSMYSTLSLILREDYRNVFLGTMDGYPGLAQVLQELEKSGATKVRLVPLLLLAGTHVLRDMDGDHPRSWRSILEERGYGVVSELSGLACRRGVQEIFLNHTRDALGITIELTPGINEGNNSSSDFDVSRTGQSRRNDA